MLEYLCKSRVRRPVTFAVAGGPDVVIREHVGNFPAVSCADLPTIRFLLRD